MAVRVPSNTLATVIKKSQRKKHQQGEESSEFENMGLSNLRRREAAFFNELLVIRPNILSWRWG